MGEIDPIAPAHTTYDVFAAQGPVENVLCISYKYVISMFDNMSAFQMSVFAAQASVESDLGISRKHVL